MEQLIGRKSSAAKVVALALGVVLLTSACAQGGTTAAGGSTTPVASLTVSGPNAPLTLDATKAAEIASLVSIYLGQGQLFRFDENLKPVPDLAESATVSADGLTATIKLRKGVVYSDKTPVVANDIKTAFDRQKAGGTVKNLLASMASVEVVDDSTAVIRMNFPDPDMLIQLTGRSLPINPTQQVKNDTTYFEHPVSAGPYVVKAWKPGDAKLELVENASYWDGPMMTKQINVVGVADIASRVLQVTSGKINFAWDLPLAALSSLPKNITTSTGPIGGYNYIAANMVVGTPFADPKVRQAMSLALDRQVISDRAFFGKAPALTSFMYSCGDLCAPGLLPNAGKQDLAAAKKLMADAGYTTTITAKMMVSSTRPGWSDAALVSAEQLKAIGIEVQVTPVDEATWIAAVASRNYQLMFSGGSAPAQSALQQVFATGGFWAAGVGYQNDETTKLVADAAKTIDTAARKALYTKIQTLGQQTMPVIPVLERVEFVANTAPTGLLVRPKNSQLFNVQTVKQAKAGLGAGQSTK
jgi:peptide/nickel transport system substrate-binding protein